MSFDPFRPPLLKRYNWKERVATGINMSVYRLEDTVSGDSLAGKVEEKANKTSSYLKQELAVLEKLAIKPGFPTCKFFTETAKEWILGTELLGPSVDKLLNLYREKLTMRTVMRLGLRMLGQLRSMHECGLVHRDVRPESFVLSRNFHTESVFNVYVTNFGLARLFIDPETKEHIPLKTRDAMVGTARFASIHVHKGMEPSRRDDLESLAYVLIFLLFGHLPWDNLKLDKKAMAGAIGDIKSGTSAKELCKGLPDELREFLEFVRGLEFNQEPDYGLLTGLLDKIVSSPDKAWDKVAEVSSAAKSAVRRSLSRSKSVLKSDGQRILVDNEKERISPVPVSPSSKPIELEADLVKFEKEVVHKPRVQKPKKGNGCMFAFCRSYDVDDIVEDDRI